MLKFGDLAADAVHGGVGVVDFAQDDLFHEARRDGRGLRNAGAERRCDAASCGDLLGNGDQFFVQCREGYQIGGVRQQDGGCQLLGNFGQSRHPMPRVEDAVRERSFVQKMARDYP